MYVLKRLMLNTNHGYLSSVTQIIKLTSRVLIDRQNDISIARTEHQPSGDFRSTAVGTVAKSQTCERIRLVFVRTKRELCVILSLFVILCWVEFRTYSLDALRGMQVLPNSLVR